MADKPHVRAPAPSPIGTASERFTAHITSPCSDKKSCGRGRFCDEYYGRCERLRRRSDFCRKDHHCHRKHECVFGRCRKEIPKGQEGSRCASDGDCPSNHCCARQHGEYICKPKLRQSMKCFVPAGGLDYSLNEQCPCENGLICRYEPLKPSTASPVNKISPKNEWFQFSSDTEHMRCLPVSSGSTTHNEDYYDVQRVTSNAKKSNNRH
ncbi:dickkopf-related protein 3-like [Paramacrobiotus metropolitanus]|uniref:dickkopf-related protein 3-like n=1 Tax=Paramacrobiotus metropolitanus TaxID=2943436 RepID=UPI002445905E|nr:dickkopf-related protein 3-like [Paramacrobiotus metropolitanus]